MLARHQIVVYPAFVVDVELHQCEAPVLGVERIFEETQEPGGGYLLVHLVVGHSVAPELYLAAQHAALAFLHHGEEVRVHQALAVDVVDAHALCEVHVLKAADALHVVVQPDAETLGLCQYDGGTRAGDVAAFGDALLAAGRLVPELREIDSFHKWVVRLGLLLNIQGLSCFLSSSGSPGAPSTVILNAATCFSHSTARS